MPKDKTWAGEGGNGEELFKGDRVFFCRMKLCWNQAEVVVAQHCEDNKCHWIVTFKMVDFMLYEFKLFNNNKKIFKEPKSKRLEGTKKSKKNVRM